MYSKPNMTEPQQQNCMAFEAMIAAEIELCCKNIRAAYSSVVRLPRKNGDNMDVTHGCNMQMEDFGSYWTARLNLIERMIEQEKFVKLTGYDNTTHVQIDARRAMRQS